MRSVYVNNMSVYAINMRSVYVINKRSVNVNNMSGVYVFAQPEASENCPSE